MKTYYKYLIMIWLFKVVTYAASVDELKSDCETDHDIDQCYQLGLAYVSGDSVAKNITEGRKYLSLACEKGKMQKACDLLNGNVRKTNSNDGFDAHSSNVVKAPMVNQQNFKKSHMGSGGYFNDKFGFSLRYPGNYFTQKRTPDAGDGVILNNATSGLDVRAYGSWSDASLSALYREMMGYIRDDGGQITYHVRKRNWFVLSGYDKDGKIFYQKTILHHGKSATLLIKYPARYKTRYDRLVGTLVHGFSF